MSACAAKWSRRSATRSGELQQGSVIGISNSVVIPPLAAAPVSDSTLPRLRIGGAADVGVDVDRAGQDVEAVRLHRLPRFGFRARRQDRDDPAARHRHRAGAEAVGREHKPAPDGEVERHLSPSSVSASATPSRWVRCMEA